ncbi:MAG: DUF1573 domain-containing protein [Rikenellaceae bacterium]
MVIFFSFCTLFSIAQKSGSQLKIEPEVVDFGTIKEENGVVKAKFRITNISKKPYIMNYSYSGCGCVSSKVSKEPLMPGASRDITVEYNPTRRPGIFNKEMTLVSNNKKHSDALKICGEVIPKAKSIAELYPIKAIDGVQLSSDVFPFGIISQNEKHTEVINLFNNSRKEVSIKVVSNGDNLGTAEISTTKLQPKRKGQLQFTYDLKGNKKYGEFSNKIELFINGKKWEHTIEVNALAIFNFFEMSDEERRMAPRAIVSPLEYNTGTVTVPIYNNGKSDLKVLSVLKSNKEVIYNLSSEVIGQGKTEKITIISKKECEVTLLFNSPDTPVVVIKLKTK